MAPRETRKLMGLLRLQRIFSTLQRYERLPLPRLKLYSRLSDRQLQNGLAAMIQHHLVFHLTSLEDGSTYYEANPRAAYYLVRSGKILHLVADRLGDYAAQIVETIMYLGHASIAHLENMPELQTRAPRPTNGVIHHEQNGVLKTEEDEDEPPHTNGNHVSPPKPPLFSTLKKLASHGYLMRVRDAHFQSPSDNYLEAQRIVSARADIKALKGKRNQEAVLQGINNLLEERTDADLSANFQINGLPRGVKRKRHGAAMSNGTNGDHAATEGTPDEFIDEEDEFDDSPMDVSYSVLYSFLESILPETKD